MDEEFDTDPRDDAPSIRIPFAISVIRKITRQCLVSYPVGKPPVHRGISQEAVVMLSLAVGIFLKNISPDVLRNAHSTHVGRKNLVKTLLESPRYRFAVTRMRPKEVLDCFTETNELSERIALSNIERPLRFPIEFVAPFPPGFSHAVSESEAVSREAANIDAAIRAIVLSHHGYRQTIPDFFKPKRPLTPKPPTPRPPPPPLA
jgi:hypothetical protein